MTVEQDQAAAPFEPAARSRLKLGAVMDLAAPAMLALVVSVGVGLYFERRADARIHDALMARPDIAVVNDIGLVQLAISNGANRYNAQEITAEIERMIKGAGLEDTILVSRSMVMYAPSEATIEVAEAKPQVELKAAARGIGP